MRDEVGELRELVRRLGDEVAALRRQMATHERTSPHRYRPHAAEHESSDRPLLNFMQVLSGIPDNFPDNRIFYDSSTSKLTIRVGGTTKVSGAFS